MMAAVLVVAVLQQPSARPAPTPPSDTAGGRPCKVLIDSVGRNWQQVEVRRGETNVFAGGGVLAHCEGTGTSLTADSIAWFPGTGRFDMLGALHPVHIRDTAIALDATNASYYMRQERLEAHRNVVAVNRSTGSVLRGPNLTYYRAVRGVRDTVEMYASSRPTIEYRTSGDSGEPYLIVADRVRFKGNDRMWGGGQVTIDRSDFAARGDSMELNQATGFGVLVGKPRVEGKGARSYALTGTRIELGLADREVRRVKALGHGVATGSDWRLTADTIHLHIDRKKLQRAFAWGPRDSIHAVAVSTLHTIRADSLALDLPDEVLTEVRGFGHAFSTSKRDSTKAAEVDWITGDSLTARWRQEPDSTGQAKSRLWQILACHAARSFSHLASQRDTTGPSINYTRGACINITLKGDKIDHVVATGPADGLHLEPKPPAPADTTKKAQP
ncbi:MAG TPA: hypothetical protein VEU55_03125 [Gemmatimonadales bacterium]|nr:hypothetical protein [Gemmatimonadales bacterium]